MAELKGKQLRDVNTWVVAVDIERKIAYLARDVGHEERDVGGNLFKKVPKWKKILHTSPTGMISNAFSKPKVMTQLDYDGAFMFDFHDFEDDLPTGVKLKLVLHSPFDKKISMLSMLPSDYVNDKKRMQDELNRCYIEIERLNRICEELASDDELRKDKARREFKKDMDYHTFGGGFRDGGGD